MNFFLRSLLVLVNGNSCEQNSLIAVYGARSSPRNKFHYCQFAGHEARDMTERSTKEEIYRNSDDIDVVVLILYRL